MGTEGRLERSKGESRQDNIHLEPGNAHINNNNEGEVVCQEVVLKSEHRERESERLKCSRQTFSPAENEETEGSEGQAEYMFGDAELDDDDLYSMEHDNQTGLSRSRLCQIRRSLASVCCYLLCLWSSFVCPVLSRNRGAGVHAAPGGLPAAPRDHG